MLASLVARMQSLTDELHDRDLTTDPEHRYKIGALLHWMEALLAACELWKATEEDEYLNAVVMQHNAFVNQFNQVISESALRTDFLPLMRQQPLRRVEAPRDFLLRLYKLAQQFRLRARRLWRSRQNEFHHRDTEVIPSK